MEKDTSQSKRSYRMNARAASAEATLQRILDTTVELFTTQDYEDITLQDIAERAGVTVPTLFRRFGSKEQLLEAAAQHAREGVMGQRHRVQPGDVDAALENLLDHYELWGDRVLRLLAQEQRVAAIRSVTDFGRKIHREWVEYAFEPLLPSEKAARLRRIAQLVAVCDVYTWKILRYDLGLSRKEITRALLEIIRAL